LKPAYIVANTLTPYVTIAEARQSDRTVQVHGYLKQVFGYDPKGSFSFSITDDNNDVMTIIYERPRPANFEQASGFVAIGRYDPTEKVFRAQKLLVKCPSKYQEQESQKPTEATP
jgi:cytochrome c-type biogenesis protein CcmE